MKLLLVFVSLAITAFGYSVTDLPPYCGAKVEEYPKAEGTLRQVHLVMRYQIMFFSLYRPEISRNYVVISVIL